QLGCASLFQRHGDYLRDSQLTQLNPAPESMSPPADTDPQHPQIDPTYMRSQADYHYTMAETLSLGGQGQKAIEEYKLVQVYDPDSPRVPLKIAGEYVRLGLLSEAIEQVEQSLKLGPEQTEAYMLLGGIYSSLKMYSMALDQYKKILTFEPNHMKAPIFIGAIYAEQKKYDEAVQVFKQLAENPENEEPENAYFYIAKVRSEQGGERADREAEKYFKKSISVRPNFLDPAMGLAALFYDKSRDKEDTKLLESFQRKFGPRSEVAQVLSRVYLQNEDFDKALEQLETLDAMDNENLNVKIQIALILIEKERFEEATSRLEDILAMEPTLDKIRFYLGAVHEETGRWRKAVENYGQISPGSAYYPDSVLHSAYLLKSKGQPEEAENLLQEAIKLREDVAQFYSFYASLLDEKKDYKKGLSLLSKAVKKFPDDVQMNFYLGTIQDRVGNTEKSIQQMLKVLELQDDHVQALNYLAYTYAELNHKLDEAESMARKALSLKPGDGFVLDTMGWILFKKGDNSGAIKFLELAVKHQNAESIIAEHLGDAYYRSQLVDKALKMYNKAVALERDSSKAGKIRDKISSIERKMAEHLRTPASAGR
ncbi:MAG: tetratricopeptide repeat protein, partial [Bdellovibrionales bacterium]|nr:tetratricopeptide repeat protein [Bdellovibrionales bacterium]